ncbi:sterol desaturase family protein, partial [Frankia sp. Cr1]|uniref:sterol desaturase family protein n=1 Tax=Frankia sp. Cr1 TaxID=3073931 RepID=UPI002AD3448C
MSVAVVGSFHLLPGWGQLAVVFVFRDLFAYFGHRALHRVPLLWRFHRIHHSSEQLDWLATSRVGARTSRHRTPSIALRPTGTRLVGRHPQTRVPPSSYLAMHAPQPHSVIRIPFGATSGR